MQPFKKFSLMPVGLLLFACLLLSVSNASAQRLPLWELGAAVGTARIPYYRGSAENQNVLLPLPLATYRGHEDNKDKPDIIQKIFKTKKFSLDTSLAVGLPVSRNSVEKRRDMPALDAVLEIGPMLETGLWRDKYQTFSLHLPLRAAVSLAWQDSAFRGLVFTPYVNYSIRSFSPNYWRFSLSVGPQFASESYHEYYYSVDEKFVNTGRRAYSAKAGYSGSRITLYANKRLGNLWLSLFTRYDFLNGAAFVDSPLVEQKSYLVAGFVLGWVFLDSPRKVTISPPDWY